MGLVQDYPTLLGIKKGNSWQQRVQSMCIVQGTEHLEELNIPLFLD